MPQLRTNTFEINNISSQKENQMNTLKFTLFTALVFILNFNSFGQDSEKKYKATIDGWKVDLEKAQALSIETGKPILANFTGSDWCGWCTKLKKEVFVKDEFIKWAKENVILLELDYPKRLVVPQKIKQQNSQLAQAFGVRGYPTIWAFTISTNEETKKSEIKGLAKTGYVAGGPKAWIKDFESKMEQHKTSK